MEHEARQHAQGNGGDPQEQDIPRHEEAGIPACPQHALGENGIHGLEHHDKADGVHELPGDFLGFRGHLVIIDDGAAHQQDHQRGKAPQHKAQTQEGIALLLGFFQISFSHGVAGHDAAGVGNALGEHGG